jgi:DNA-binding MarR family transcriptional regulator
VAIKQILNAFNLTPGTVVRSERHVLLELANFADGKKGATTDTCYPGIETLAERTGYSEVTVSRAIKKLVEKGLVTKHRRFNTSNFYKVNIPEKEKHTRVC